MAPNSDAIGKPSEGMIPVSAVSEKYPTPDEHSVERDASNRESDSPAAHGTPELLGSGVGAREGPPAVVDVRRKWFAYVKTKEFWLALLLGQVASLCLTGTNTLTGLLQQGNCSIPAFQTFVNYALLFLTFSPYTFVKYGPKKWAKMVLKDGWKYFIFSFFDVEGNYFVVLGYRYTNILSAQLINFTSIVIVVIVSFTLLKVRYHWTQILGILVCIGGVGVLVASDRITGSTSLAATNQVKGDLFVLLAATCYGFSNIIEEVLVSEKPLYEVLGQLGLWGMCINGVQSAIFDRQSFRNADWTSKNGGYFAGYNLLLFLFYLVVPILLRIASAAFFNISGLTGAFWGVVIGVKVFGYHIHYLYPIAFVMIILGLFLYFVMCSVLGEANKPWLGENQEKGVNGVGTGRRIIEKKAAATGNIEGTIV